jgi:uncharacterized protein (DUF885 family)
MLHLLEFRYTIKTMRIYHPIALVGFFLIGSLFSSCSDSKKETLNSEEQFNQMKERFVLQLWKVFPSWASGSGFHDYDEVLTIPDENNRTLENQFATAWIDSLNMIPLNELSISNRMDWEMMKNQLESILFYNNVFKSHEWNPSNYNLGGSFSEILNSEHANTETRLRALMKRLEKVADYYAAAKANIKNPTIEHTQLAIQQNRGAKETFSSEIPEAAAKSQLSEEEKNRLSQLCNKALTAIDDYVNWLEETDNANPRTFRLGKDLYQKKFAIDIQSGLSAEQLYNKALARKAELHKKMYELAMKLWPMHLGKQPYPKDSLELVRLIIDKLSVQHVHRDSFQSAIEQQIPELAAFVREKDLLYLDPEKPLVVRKEPAYMQGVAGASISSPGPYDKNGKTYYNVGSLAGYTPEQAESYLREYNHYILQILNIHEAIPGHYAQLVYSNKAPSIIKSLFGNGSMIEGWAVYSELMMLENGYGNNSDEMWLMYYKWNLRSVCNTILDYSVHNLDMSKEQALDLLMRQAFQQRTEAEGKWRRATLTQVQLTSYFNGFAEIVELREQLKQKKGEEFNLKQFHETFLSFGSAPVKLIAEVMLQTF